MKSTPTPPFDCFWRVKTVHPERFKTLCRIIKRKSHMVVAVEFRDGFRTYCPTMYLKHIPRKVLA